MLRAQRRCSLWASCVVEFKGDSAVLIGWAKLFFLFWLGFFTGCWKCPGPLCRQPRPKSCGDCLANAKGFVVSAPFKFFPDLVLRGRRVPFLIYMQITRVRNENSRNICIGCHADVCNFFCCCCFATGSAFCIHKAPTTVFSVILKP